MKMGNVFEFVRGHKDMGFALRCGKLHCYVENRWWKIVLYRRITEFFLGFRYDKRDGSAGIVHLGFGWILVDLFWGDGR